MDIPFVGWVFLSVVASGLAGCYIFFVMFAHELADRLVSPMADGRSRAADRGRTPRSVSWGYASMLSGATAVVAGIGSAVITAALQAGDPLHVLIPLVAALAGAGWSAVAVLRRRRGGGRWLSRTRSHLDPRSWPADPAGQAQARARLRRIESTGARLTDRANGLTFHSRLRRPAWTDLLTAVVWLGTAAVTALVMGVMVVAVSMDPGRPDIIELAAAPAVLGLAVLAGPAGMLLRHGNRRRRLLRIGTELTESARRATEGPSPQPG